MTVWPKARKARLVNGKVVWENDDRIYIETSNDEWNPGYTRTSERDPS